MGGLLCLQETASANYSVSEKAQNRFDQSKTISTGGLVSNDNLILIGLGEFLGNTRMRGYMHLTISSVERKTSHMQFLYFVVALFACIIGKICGMGGGVIIKPVLDFIGIDPLAVINFLSGCTVLGMSCWSVGKSSLKRESDIDWTTSTPLALGAAAGGVFGKNMFSHISGLFAYSDSAGAVQAILLLVATFFTLVYMIKKDLIQGHKMSSKPVCAVIGFALGALGAFLGIGGGPFNMAVLYYFFSMSTKVAAQNSLYVILISQTTSLVSTIITGKVPDVALWVLTGMILCGIMGICVYNIFRFV